MKQILFIILLFAGVSFAQDYRVDYYGAGNPLSDQLIIADGDSLSGEYWATNTPIIIQVDANWTASNIGFMVYNPLTAGWELLQDKDDALLEYDIDEGSATAIIPNEGAALVRFKIAKITSGSYVAQSGAASRIAVHTVNVLP